MNSFVFSTFDAQLSVIDQLVIHADLHTSSFEGENILKLDEYLGTVFMRFNFIIERLQVLDEGRMVLILEESRKDSCSLFRGYLASSSHHKRHIRSSAERAGGEDG